MIKNILELAYAASGVSSIPTKVQSFPSLPQLYPSPIWFNSSIHRTNPKLKHPYQQRISTFSAGSIS